MFGRIHSIALIGFMAVGVATGCTESDPPSPRTSQGLEANEAEALSEASRPDASEVGREFREALQMTAEYTEAKTRDFQRWASGQSHDLREDWQEFRTERATDADRTNDIDAEDAFERNLDRLDAKLAAMTEATGEAFDEAKQDVSVELERLRAKFQEMSEDRVSTPAVTSESEN